VTSTELPPRSTGFQASVSIVNAIVTGLTRVTGDDVIVHPSIKTEEAQKIFPKINIVKPYLRFTPLPKEQTSAAL